MTLSKRKVGRPPAVWMQELSKMEIKEDQFFTKEEFAEYFSITPGAVKNFCERNKMTGEYHTKDGHIRIYYSLKAMQKVAKTYIKKRLI